MDILVTLSSAVLQLAILFIARASSEDQQQPVVGYGSRSRCDWSKCLSPQLNDATRTEDKHNICRLLTPSLHCMQTKLPACRRLMGEDNEMYQVFEKELKHLHTVYADKCHAIYTTCKEFSKCLRPEIQKASHHHDIRSLCQIAPPVISCFENAIQTCQARSRFEEDVNFELIENKLDKLRLQTAARCCGFSHRLGNSCASLLHIASLVVVLLLQRI